MNKGAASSWSEFEKTAAESLKELEGTKGKGLALVYEPTKSPSLQRMLADVKAKLPEAMFVAYDPVDRSNQSKAIAAAGGGNASLLYRLDAAK